MKNLTIAPVFGLLLIAIWGCGPKTIDPKAMSQSSSKNDAKVMTGPIAVGTEANQEWSNNGPKIRFCWCPPGKFTMGSPKDEPQRESDEDQVSVTLTKGFWMGKYEVTQGEWHHVMATSISEQRKKAASNPQEASYVHYEQQAEGDALPMFDVDHDDTVEFCNTLTRQERAAGRLPAEWAYMLPTEAQWEYACRAGTTTAMAFGETLNNSQANFGGKLPIDGAEFDLNMKTIVRVGSYPPNAWGLCDMHGNVMEWCRGWYAKELLGGSDPEMAIESSFRVNRGGSWFSDGRYCRSAFRNFVNPIDRTLHLGFRVVAVQVSR